MNVEASAKAVDEDMATAVSNIIEDDSDFVDVDKS